MKVSAYFYDGPGSPLDRAAHHIFQSHNGRSIGSGTAVSGSNAGERDIQYDVSDDCAAACRAALRKAGLRLQSAAEETSSLPDKRAIIERQHKRDFDAAIASAFDNGMTVPERQAAQRFVGRVTRPKGT